MRTKMKNRNALVIFLLSLFLILGLILGTSITGFILFLLKSDHILAIISYLFLGIFTILIIVMMYIFNKYRNVIFSKSNKEEQQNEEKSE